jgi:hypothetical protein
MYMWVIAQTVKEKCIMFTRTQTPRRLRQDTRRVLAEHQVWWQNLGCSDFQEELGLLGHNRQNSNQVHVDRFAGVAQMVRR